MASPRIEYAVLPAGEGPGQDRCFTADGLVVVLDGASAIDPVANPDATEYVDTLGPLLIEQVTSTQGVDLRDALADAIRLTAHELALVPGTAPSSTVSIVRWGDEWVDVLVLGDSPVVINLADDRHETVVQHPQDHIAAGLRAQYRARLVAGNGFDVKHRELLAEIQRRESLARNRPEGYWIAEGDPSAAYRALVFQAFASDVIAIVVATDGADALVGAQENLSKLTEVPLAADLRSQLALLAAWEAEEDPAGRLRPRSKRHDDKTLAVMTRGNRTSPRWTSRVQ